MACLIKYDVDRFHEKHVELQRNLEMNARNTSLSQGEEINLDK
jgi:hypothetical protein